MSGRALGFGIETLYTSFTLFFYYYVGRTLVSLNPFSFGFHPPTNIEELSTALLFIVLIVLLAKSISVLSFMLNAEDPKQHAGFYPSQRN